MTIEIGQRLAGRYEVHAIAGGPGRSGMGVVYLCYDPEGGGTLALKTYQERVFQDQSLVGHFKQGAESWMALDQHPHLVRALDVFDIADRLYLGLEYIAPDDDQRNTLAHYLGGELKLATVLRWSIEFCDAMEHTRSRGVTPHRDIKPDSLMISRDGALKVSDFGLAGDWVDSGAVDADAEASFHRSMIALTGDRHIVGTPAWMAPEQFWGESSVQSDAYSFGVVLYQMLAHGRLPYRADDDRDWATTHQIAEPEPLVSPLWPIAERCLAKEPARRFGGSAPATGFRDLRAALRAL